MEKNQYDLLSVRTGMKVFGTVLVKYTTTTVSVNYIGKDEEYVWETPDGRIILDVVYHHNRLYVLVDGDLFTVRIPTMETTTRPCSSMIYRLELVDGVDPLLVFVCTDDEYVALWVNHKHPTYKTYDPPNIVKKQTVTIDDQKLYIYYDTLGRIYLRSPCMVVYHQLNNLHENQRYIDSIKDMDIDGTKITILASPIKGYSSEDLIMTFDLTTDDVIFGKYMIDNSDLIGSLKQAIKF